MTWAEKEVPSLELCKKLKELEFPQESDSGWYWVLYKQPTYKKWVVGCKNNKFNSKEWLIYNDKLFYITNSVVDYIKAPTCREILEWIDIVYQKHITGCYLTEKLTYAPDEIEPNRLAKDLIWLAENGYVKFK